MEKPPVVDNPVGGRLGGLTSGLRSQSKNTVLCLTFLPSTRREELHAAPRCQSIRAFGRQPSTTSAPKPSSPCTRLWRWTQSTSKPLGTFAGRSWIARQRASTQKTWPSKGFGRFMVTEALQARKGNKEIRCGQTHQQGSKSIRSAFIRAGAPSAFLCHRRPLGCPR